MCKLSGDRFVVTMQTLLLLLLLAAKLSETAICNYTPDANTNICEVPTCPSYGHKPILYFLVMGPYPRTESDPGAEPNWQGGPAVIPGALLAIEHINCDARILPDFQIKAIISDGGCHLRNTRALVNFTTNIYLNQTAEPDGDVVGIIGGACSESAFLVAEHVTRDPLSLVQIAPSATSPLFVTQSEDYSNTIRLTVNALLFVNVFKQIIRQEQYEEVAILYDSERSYHLEISNHFQAALTKDDVIVSRVQPLFETYLVQPLEQLENKNRLIFVFAGRKLAINILCLAYRKNMLYPNYQFIFINRRASNFQVDVSVNISEDTMMNCSIEEMKAALRTATIFEPRVTRSDREIKTYSGYNYNEIECQYNKVLEDHKKYLCQSMVTDTEYQNAYYDSTWALAISLHHAQSEVDLSTYKYGQPNRTKAILNQFFNLSFEGAFGRVSFNNRTFDTEDVAIVNIFQQTLINGTINSTVVAFYKSEAQILNISDDAWFVNSSVFKQAESIHPPVQLAWAVVALIVFLSLVIGVLHYLNGTVGDLKHVKATSPQLNHLIFSGCYLLMMGALVYTCVSVFFDVYKLGTVLTSVLCNVQAWVSNYAVSLIFGTICMKTWRIWRIFNHFSSKPIRFAGDTVLIGFVLGLLFLDSIVLVTWAIEDPLRIKTLGKNMKISVCLSESVYKWVIPLVLFKCILIIAMLFLSIKTRKIPKKEFKQTKAINTLLYILLFNLTLGLGPYAIVSTSQSSDLVFTILAYVLYCGAYIFATVFCVIFIFIPPIYPLIRRKWIVFTTLIN